MNAKPTVDARTVETIIQVICDFFHIDPASLKTKYDTDYLFIRKITAHILFNRYKLSSTDAARLLGCRNHTSITEMNAEVIGILNHEGTQSADKQKTIQLIRDLCEKIEEKLNLPSQILPTTQRLTGSATNLLGVAVQVCPSILRKAPAINGVSPVEISKRMAIFIAWKDQQKTIDCLMNEFDVSAVEVMTAIGFVDYFGSDGLSAEVEEMLTGIRKRMVSVS